MHTLGSKPLDKAPNSIGAKMWPVVGDARSRPAALTTITGVGDQDLQNMRDDFMTRGERSARAGIILQLCAVSQERITMSAPKSTEIRRGLYTILKCSADLYPFETRLSVFKISHSLTWSIWLLRVAYDLLFTMLIPGGSFCNTWNLRTAILAEFFLTCPEALGALNVMLGLFSGIADQPRPKYGLCGEAAPAVDVMITSCGEPVPVVVNTVKAEIAQNYPRQSLRIFVLDDGRDAVLQTAVETLMLDLERTSGPTLKYLSRAKDRTAKSYFKSGNFRFGIDASQRIGGGSEFLAGLDADMIVDPDWLRKMVPHLILNDRVACVCGPQVRYTSISNRSLGYQTVKTSKKTSKTSLTLWLSRTTTMSPYRTRWASKPSSIWVSLSKGSSMTASALPCAPVPAMLRGAAPWPRLVDGRWLTLAKIICVRHYWLARAGRLSLRASPCRWVWHRSR